MHMDTSATPACQNAAERWSAPLSGGCRELLLTFIMPATNKHHLEMTTSLLDRTAHDLSLLENLTGMVL